MRIARIEFGSSIGIAATNRSTLLATSWWTNDGDADSSAIDRS